ncbi:MAG TPA: beta-(1-6) glucans synthase [Pseudolabrys sp.]|jgi:exo-beta-1,3-glucanase (GH17 family)
MRQALFCLALAVVAIAGVWLWIGNPVLMPYPQMAHSGKLFCLSYTPFRGRQTPLDPATIIPASQIDDDLARLVPITDCIRTYSVDFGLDQIPEIAAKYGLKVMQGLWLSSHPEKNRYQIETAVALANRFPGTIRSVVVGNEVLLRGEMAATDLEKTIREVKARVHVPVTYADVWEFWLRNTDIANAVDFVTIHILPYWEDFPISADRAAEHVESIRRRVVTAFPGKEVLIGEVGWPSAGRMREGALPSPVNQAKVIQDVLALSKLENFNVNVIEAFDQPWKRALEGTVGGHWGLLDGATRAPKFGWAQPVSNHPYWIWQGAGGILFSILVFGVALRAGNAQASVLQWIGVTVNAAAGGILIGWAIENAPLESLGIAGWSRSLTLLATAFLAPPVLSIAIMRGTVVPNFTQLLGPKEHRVGEPLARLAGAILLVVMLLAFVIALGLVFDPRYRDFPFAPLTAAVVPFPVHSLLVPRIKGKRSAAETAAALVLALSVGYIVFNESFANWQSLWLCAVLAVLAFNLAQVRASQS